MRSVTIWCEHATGNLLAHSAASFAVLKRNLTFIISAFILVVSYSTLADITNFGKQKAPREEIHVTLSSADVSVLYVPMSSSRSMVS